MYLYTPSFDFTKNHRKYRRFSCIQVLLCVLNRDESRKRVNTVCVICKRNDVSVKNTTQDRVRTQLPVATDRHHIIFGYNGNRYFPEQVKTCLFFVIVPTTRGRTRQLVCRRSSICLQIFAEGSRLRDSAITCGYRQMLHYIRIWQQLIYKTFLAYLHIISSRFAHTDTCIFYEFLLF